MKRQMVMALGMLLSITLMAQKRSPIQWTGVLKTEANMNFNNGEANGNALFFLDANAKLWEGGRIYFGFQSMYSVRDEQGKSWSVVSDERDRTWFTNINLKNLPFTIGILGLSQEITPNFDVFFGVRKTDYDYFTTPYSRLFLNTGVICNSTLNSDRWNISNFNTAALCLHFNWYFLDGWTLKNSVYNGNGTDDVSKMFRFRPSRDGIMDIVEIGYRGWNDKSLVGEYHLGMMWGDTYLNEYDDNKKRSQAVFYASANQPLLKGKYPIGFFAQGSIGPKNVRSAYNYFSLGALIDNLVLDGTRIGVNVNRAIFANGERETDLEVTALVPVMPGLTLQPGVHFLRTSGLSTTAGLMRAIFAF